MSLFSSHTEKLLAEKKCVLERVTGKDLQGRELFAYVLLKKSRLPEFRAALASVDVDLATFGVVLAYGKGHVPPEGLEEEVIRRLNKEEDA